MFTIETTDLSNVTVLHKYAIESHFVEAYSRMLADRRYCMVHVI
jgi:hypothetical protein